MPTQHIEGERLTPTAEYILNKIAAQKGLPRTAVLEYLLSVYAVQQRWNIPADVARLGDKLERAPGVLTDPAHVRPDDPLWDEVIDNIRAERKRIDAEEV